MLSNLRMQWFQGKVILKGSEQFFQGKAILECTDK